MMGAEVREFLRVAESIGPTPGPLAVSPIVERTQSEAWRVVTMNWSAPIKLVSEANMREHWRVKAKRVGTQRLAAMTHTMRALRKEGIWTKVSFARATVAIDRIGVRDLDEDNLAGACKAIRDGVCDALGVDDRDKRYTWVRRQRQGMPPGVEVTVTLWIAKGES